MTKQITPTEVIVKKLELTVAVLGHKGIIADYIDDFDRFYEAISKAVARNDFAEEDQPS